MRRPRDGSAPERRTSPAGLLLGGLAGLAAVSLVWPALALRDNPLWLLGMLVGAGLGALLRALLGQLIGAWHRGTLSPGHR